MVTNHLQYIFLPEYQSVSIAFDRIDYESGELLWREFGKYLSVEFPSPKTDKMWEIRSMGYVGHIPLKDNLALSLTPKTEIGNIFRMLEWAYDLDSFKILDGMTNSSSLEDVYQCLAKILAKRILDRGRKGLYREYKSSKERLPYLCGRVDMAKTMLKPWQVNFPCHYEEHTSDNEENQILSWTLFCIARSGICGKDSLAYIRQAFLQMRGASTIEQKFPKDCIGRLYNRLNCDYHPMHALCRFFLEHTGPSHEIGNKKMIPFLVNMGRLYELFVARWFKKNMDSFFDLKSQEHISLGKDNSFNMAIDLVLKDAETKEPLCVMDTKYKTPDKVSTADVYQIISYAVAKGCKNAYLIYPEALQEPLDITNNDIRVQSLCFGLSGDLDEQGKNFYSSLIDKLSVVKECKCISNASLE